MVRRCIATVVSSVATTLELAIIANAVISHGKRSSEHTLGEKPLHMEPTWKEDGGLYPHGFHLALSGPNSVKLLWQTAANLNVSYSAICLYGATNTSMTLTSSGRSYTYTANGFTGSLHEVALSDLKAGRAIFYRCGCKAHMSQVFHFTLQPTVVRDDEDRPWIGAIADMGIQKADETRASLLQSLLSGQIHLLVHAGDMSYADDYKPVGNSSYVWDTYMDQMQAIVANVPYMTCPGNHERPFDFASYVNRFRMPYSLSDSPSPLYYSFDYLGIHFTMFSTEEDFSNGTAQHKWIEEDLAKASLNRNKVPWIIVVGHRPLYCSDLIQYLPRCLGEAVFFRRDLEWLLQKYKVDVYLCGHDHQYERTYPVFQLRATSQSYKNPNATVYIVNGAAGSREKIDPTYVSEDMVPWRAAHGFLEETSWLRMRPGPRTLEFEAVRSANSEVFDRFIIEK